MKAKLTPPTPLRKGNHTPSRVLTSSTCEQNFKRWIWLKSWLALGLLWEREVFKDSAAKNNVLPIFYCISKDLVNYYCPAETGSCRAHHFCWKVSRHFTPGLRHPKWECLWRQQDPNVSSCPQDRFQKPRVAGSDCFVFDSGKGAARNSILKQEFFRSANKSIQHITSIPPTEINTVNNSANNLPFFAF